MAEDEEQEPTEEKPKRQGPPGEVVAKFEGQAWDLLPEEDLKEGTEREFIVRASVEAGGWRRMATGVIRKTVGLKVRGVALIPVTEERFPSMPRGKYADQQTLPLSTDEEE